MNGDQCSLTGIAGIYRANRRKQVGLGDAVAYERGAELRVDDVEMALELGQDIVTQGNVNATLNDSLLDGHADPHRAEHARERTTQDAGHA